MEKLWKFVQVSMCLLEVGSKITITACSLVQDVELQVYRLMLSHQVAQTNLEVLKSIWKFNIVSQQWKKAVVFPLLL